MRGSKAKEIRRNIYGDLSTKDRKYYRDTKTGAINRDLDRRIYKIAKRSGIEHALRVKEVVIKKYGRRQ